MKKCTTVLSVQNGQNNNENLIIFLCLVIVNVTKYYNAAEMLNMTDLWLSGARVFSSSNLLNTPKLVFGRGSSPDPAGGAHDAPPDTLVDWGTLSPRRLWRLDLGAGPPTQIPWLRLWIPSLNWGGQSWRWQRIRCSNSGNHARTHLQVYSPELA